jgi:hypothetical protein
VENRAAAEGKVEPMENIVEFEPDPLRVRMRHNSKTPSAGGIILAFAIPAGKDAQKDKQSKAQGLIDRGETPAPR